MKNGKKQKKHNDTRHIFEKHQAEHTFATKRLRKTRQYENNATQ